MSKFIKDCWPNGATPDGERETRSCFRISDEYDAFMKGEIPESESESIELEAASLEFALESHLRDFLGKNLEHVEPGLTLCQIDGRSGIEFPVEAGRIDLLAKDKIGKYVVLELKLSQGRNKALGQLLYYMAWVDRRFGNGPCRGVIVASEISEELKIAIA